MILNRFPGSGHPSYSVWQDLNNLINRNIGIFSSTDDYDTISDKLYDLLANNPIKNIGSRSVIYAASQIAEYLEITPDTN